MSYDQGVKRVMRCVAVSVVLGWGLFQGDQARAGSPSEAAVISRLQALAGQEISAAEWNGVVADIDDLIATARASSDWNAVVYRTVIKARAYTARGMNAEALALLVGVIDEAGDRNLPALRMAYREAADLYARSGREQEVVDLMNRFRKSPAYDGETYVFSGGEAPGDPLLVQRPAAPAEDSISLTAMQVARTKARFAPGTVFPDFSVTAWDGRLVRLADMSGRVVLVDFWVSGWHAWRQDAPYRKSIHQRYRDRGFEIIGMNMDADRGKAKSALAEYGITWPQCEPPRSLLKELGIFGETVNFLINRQGVIVGRNLYGAALDEAVRKALQP